MRYSTVLVTVSKEVIVSVPSLLTVVVTVMVSGAPSTVVVTISPGIVVVITADETTVVMVVVRRAVIVVAVGSVVVTVIVDPGAGAGTRTATQSSLPPFSKTVLEILSHTKRLPKANANAVEGSLLAVLLLISVESMISRQAATRSTTPRARSSCPVTISSISGYTACSQNISPT